MASKKIKNFRKMINKYLVCIMGLLLLCVFLIIKPAVNNSVTKIYFIVSIISVVLISALIFQSINHLTIDDEYEKKTVFKITYELADFFALFIAACCFFQAFFVFGYFKADVDGASMYPTLNDLDVVIVRSSKDVDNFDIVIVEYNSKYNFVGDFDGNDYYDRYGYIDNKLLVKRLIGKGGDTITFVAGCLFLNGKIIDEPYIYRREYFHDDFDLSKYVGNGVYYDENQDEYIISEGYYFVMGDNRGYSADSRVLGLFRKSQLIGKIEFRAVTLTNWERYDGEKFV